MIDPTLRANGASCRVYHNLAALRLRLGDGAGLLGDGGEGRVEGEEFLGEFFDDLGVAVADEGLDQGCRQGAAEGELVPVAFVPVVGGLDFVVAVAEFDGVVGIAFEGEVVGAVERHAGEDFVTDSEQQYSVAESYIFGGMGE